MRPWIPPPHISSSFPRSFIKDQKCSFQDLIKEQKKKPHSFDSMRNGIDRSMAIPPHSSMIMLENSPECIVSSMDVSISSYGAKICLSMSPSATKRKARSSGNEHRILSSNHTRPRSNRIKKIASIEIHLAQLEFLPDSFLFLHLISSILALTSNQRSTHYLSLFLRDLLSLFPLTSTNRLCFKAFFIHACLSWLWTHRPMEGTEDRSLASSSTRE